MPAAAEQRHLPPHPRRGSRPVTGPAEALRGPAGQAAGHAPQRRHAGLPRRRDEAAAGAQRAAVGGGGAGPQPHGAPQPQGARQGGAQTHCSAQNRASARRWPTAGCAGTCVVAACWLVVEEITQLDMALWADRREVPAAGRCPRCWTLGPGGARPRRGAPARAHGEHALRPRRLRVRALDAAQAAGAAARHAAQPRGDLRQLPEAHASGPGASGPGVGPPDGAPPVRRRLAGDRLRSTGNGVGATRAPRCDRPGPARCAPARRRAPAAV